MINEAPNYIRKPFFYFRYLMYLFFLLIKGKQPRIYKKINIMTISDTLDILKKENNPSIIRFGDGEMNIIARNDIGFQSESLSLSEKMKVVLNTRDSTLLISIPNIFGSLKSFDIEAEYYWITHREEYYDLYNSYIDSEYLYGDALVFRPYICFNKKERKYVGNYFEQIKSLWTNKEIVIIEGKYTRMGVGNDLFDGAKKIERIICPSSNAYDKYQTILDNALTINKEKLILLSLGPCAKVLGYDMWKLGYHVLDIGHIDSEYEWYLHNVEWKKRMNNNKHYADIVDLENIVECQDVSYNSQILMDISGVN